MLVHDKDPHDTAYDLIVKNSHVSRVGPQYDVVVVLEIVPSTVNFPDGQNFLIVPGCRFPHRHIHGLVICTEISATRYAKTQTKHIRTKSNDTMQDEPSHYFSSNNVRLLPCTSLQVKTHNQND